MWGYYHSCIASKLQRSSAKRKTLAKLVGLVCRLIDGVAGLNKSNRSVYFFGAWHPVVALAELPVRQAQSAVLMNPNCHGESMWLLDVAGIEVESIDWGE